MKDSRGKLVDWLCPGFARVCCRLWYTQAFQCAGHLEFPLQLFYVWLDELGKQLSPIPMALDCVDAQYALTPVPCVIVLDHSLLHVLNAAEAQCITPVYYDSMLVR